MFSTSINYTLEGILLALQSLQLTETTYPDSLLYFFLAFYFCGS